MQPSWGRRERAECQAWCGHCRRLALDRQTRGPDVAGLPSTAESRHELGLILLDLGQFAQTSSQTRPHAVQECPTAAEASTRAGSDRRCTAPCEFESERNAEPRLPHKHRSPIWGPETGHQWQSASGSPVAGLAPVPDTGSGDQDAPCRSFASRTGRRDRALRSTSPSLPRTRRGCPHIAPAALH